MPAWQWNRFGRWHFWSAPGAKGLCVLGLRPIVKPSPENQPVLQLPLPEIIPANGSANGTQGAPCNCTMERLSY
jgi:hypothetical protein